MDEMEKDVVEEVEETSEEKIDETVEIEPLYTEDEIQQMALDQDKNGYIKEHKDTFVGICNTLLDYLYDARDRKDLSDIKISNEDLKNLLSLAKETEDIRYKIQHEQPLIDLEFARLALAAQFVGESMRTDGNQLLEAADKIFAMVQELIKQNVD